MNEQLYRLMQSVLHPVAATTVLVAWIGFLASTPTDQIAASLDRVVMGFGLLVYACVLFLANDDREIRGQDYGRTTFAWDVFTVASITFAGTTLMRDEPTWLMETKGELETLRWVLALPGLALVSAYHVYLNLRRSIHPWFTATSFLRFVVLSAGCFAIGMFPDSSASTGTAFAFLTLSLIYGANLLNRAQVRARSSSSPSSLSEDELSRPEDPRSGR